MPSFLDKARSAHGDRYDYSQAVYVDSHTPVKIICPEHGVFEQRPHAHVSRTQKQGCPKCGLVVPSVGRWSRCRLCI